MSGLDYMPYTIVGGTVLASFLAPAFMGWDVWYVPLIVLPFGIAYLLFDRTLKGREDEH